MVRIASSRSKVFIAIWLHTLSEAILAVGGGVGERPGNQAEFFYPENSTWKDIGAFSDIYAIFMSPVLYYDYMFIMFGGMIITNDKRAISTSTIMKLDENTKIWSAIGELRQQRSIIFYFCTVIHCTAIHRNSFCRQLSDTSKPWSISRHNHFRFWSYEIWYKW